jgi:hypothetical protein
MSGQNLSAYQRRDLSHRARLIGLLLRVHSTPEFICLTPMLVAPMVNLVRYEAPLTVHLLRFLPLPSVTDSSVFAATMPEVL